MQPDIQDLQQQVDRLCGELEQSRKTQLQLQLELFIYNSEHTGRIDSELRELYGEKFCSDWFVMFLFGPKRRSTGAQTFQGGLPLHEITALLMPIVRLRGQFAFFPLREATACVANLRLSRGQSVRGWLDDLTDAMQHLLQNDSPKGLRCVIGQALQGTPNIQKLNRTVQIAWDHGMDQNASVTSWHRMDWDALQNRMPDREHAGTPLPILEKQFMQYVNNHQFYEAVLVLDELTNRRIWQTRAPLSHIRSGVFFRLESVLATCGVSISPDETSAEIYSVLEQVMHSQDFRELRSTTYDVFALLDDLINKAEAKTKKAQLIHQFIEDNYADPGLDAAMICAHFRLSEVYLSRVFKEAYQISWLDYVHHVRLEHAKELLEQTDRKIDDIAETVGFTARTMSRLFKRAEGMPPGAYRVAMQSR